MPDPDRDPHSPLRPTQVIVSGATSSDAWLIVRDVQYTETTGHEGAVIALAVSDSGLGSSWSPDALDMATVLAALQKAEAVLHTHSVGVGLGGGKKRAAAVAAATGGFSEGGRGFPSIVGGDDKEGSAARSKLSSKVDGDGFGAGGLGGLGGASSAAALSSSSSASSSSCASSAPKKMTIKEANRMPLSLDGAPFALGSDDEEGHLAAAVAAPCTRDEENAILLDDDGVDLDVAPSTFPEPDAQAEKDADLIRGLSVSRASSISGNAAQRRTSYVVGDVQAGFNEVKNGIMEKLNPKPTLSKVEMLEEAKALQELYDGGYYTDAELAAEKAALKKNMEVPLRMRRRREKEKRKYRC